MTAGNSVSEAVDEQQDVMLKTFLGKINVCCPRIETFNILPYKFCWIQVIVDNYHMSFRTKIGERNP